MAGIKGTIGSSLGGAASGAAAGTAVMPGWGTLIGAGLGGLGGLFTGLSAADDEERRLDALKAAMKQYDASMDSAQGILDDYYSGRTSMGTESDAETFRRMLSEYDPSEFVYEADAFDKDKYDVNDYFDRNRGNQVNAAANAAQATAAGQNLGRGTAAVNAIANAVVNKNAELSDEAYRRMSDDRDFDYKLYSDDITRNQNRLDILRQGYADRMNAYNTLGQDYYQSEADRAQAYADLAMNRANAKMNFGLASANV